MRAQVHPTSDGDATIAPASGARLDDRMQAAHVLHSPRCRCCPLCNPAEASTAQAGFKLGSGLLRRAQPPRSPGQRLQSLPGRRTGRQDRRRLVR